jgi:hypothetical protein
MMTRIKRLFTGGSAANQQLRAFVASALLLLLAIEGATLLNVRSLLTVHAFVGMLLIPVVALKLASTSWRMLRHYRNAEEYVCHGPPHVALRVSLVAGAVAAGGVLAVATLPAADRLQDRSASRIGLDAR